MNTLSHYIYIGFCLLYSFIYSQSSLSNEFVAEHIKTVRFSNTNNVKGVPILKLGEPLFLNFDDINGDEADYYYSITHHNFDWTPSNLSKNEYLRGFDDMRIDTYENSFNTLQLYSNYTLQIPNEDIQGLKVSGNYMISIHNEDQELVLSRKFIIYEPLVTVKTVTKRSRDLRYINTKQVVQFEIYSPNEILRNPNRSIHTVVMQNNDLHHAITNLKPQFAIGDKLIYKYDQEASFWSGNEYLYFDNKEIRSSTVNINTIEVKDLYHHYLYTDTSRADLPYTYFPDINGSFVVRKLYAQDNNTEADYAWVDFTLEQYQPIGDSEIHIFGGFNNFTINDSTKMIYDTKKGNYHLKKKFKQGFYNYKYILVHPDGTIDPGFISGNFDVTENQYTVIVYYKAPSARYDKVIGLGNTNSKTITN